MLKEREKYYIQLIKESESFIEVCKKANIVPTTGNYDTLKKVVKRNDLDISHFKRHGGGFHERKSTSVYLNNEFPISHYKLKNRLLKEGYKEHVCEKCGRTEWNGQPIPLELHHINGDNTDNRLENLQILCPNCHAQTNNYSGKNQKSNIKKRYCKTCGKELKKGQYVYCSFECRYGNPTEEVKKEAKTCSTVKELSERVKHTEKTVRTILRKHNIRLKKKINNKNDKIKAENDKRIPLIIETLKRTKSFTQTAREFGVSDNAIRHLIAKRGYPTHIKELLNLINKSQ